MSENLKKIRISTGFEAEIDTAILDDAELMIMLGKSSKEKPMALYYMSEVVEKLIGEEKKEELMDSLRTAEGRVPIEDFSNAVKEIFEEIGKKN